MKGVKVIKGIK